MPPLVLKFIVKGQSPISLQYMTDSSGSSMSLLLQCQNIYIMHEKMGLWEKLTKGKLVSSFFQKFSLSRLNTVYLNHYCYTKSEENPVI